MVLDASGSTDPDGNKLIYKWSVYTEPSSYKGEVKIEGIMRKNAKCIFLLMLRAKTYISF